MSKKNPVTSPKEASKAGKILQDPNSSKLLKEMAAIALGNAKHKNKKG